MLIHSFENLQGVPSRNLLRGAPSPTMAIQVSLKQPAKRTFITFREERDFQGKSIQGGGAKKGECATLPSYSFSTRHEKLIGPVPESLSETQRNVERNVGAVL